MLRSLQRHPFAVEAFLRWSLVLTYAVPARALRSLLPKGLEPDVDGDLGFLAIALVQTERLRPKGLPRLVGRDLFLSGYRVFARFSRQGRPPLRGLRILRSDTDRRMMAILGNWFTHYGYRLAEVEVARDGARLRIDVRTPGGEADLHVEADVAGTTKLPETSPFRTLADARRFAGPQIYSRSAPGSSTFCRAGSGSVSRRPPV